jgi:hypothetical protein
MDLGPATPVVDGTFVFTDEAAAGARFYRVRSMITISNTLGD